MSKYVLLKKTFTGKPQMVEPEQIMEIVDSEGEYYQSLFFYNEEHKEMLKQKGTVKGVTDVKTDKLFFDFDDETNLDNAKLDAQTVVNRLVENSVNPKDIQIFFSSNKGFHVQVETETLFTPKEVSTICNNLAKDLKTFDTSLYDAAQIVRVPWTKNPKSGLHKIPLTVQQLNSPIEEIKTLATSIDNVQTEFDWGKSKVDTSHLKKTKEEPKKKKEVKTLEFDLTSRPKHWKDYKWALLNAVEVKASERHEALMRIAATCRALGYTEDLTTAMCLAFDEKFQKNTKKPPVEDLEKNIIPSIFSDNWNGGQYSYKNDIWLQNYCERIGLKPEEQDTKNIMSIDDVFNEFNDFSQDFESNIVRTGIRDLDENVLFLTSTHNGIVGNPGSGKTSLVIQWLENLSAKGDYCFFYSLDMAEPIIGAKLIQRVTGLSFEESMKLPYKDNDRYLKVKEEIKDKFKNVQFIFTSGTTTERIKNDILSYEESTGNKVRLLVVDYLECLQGPYSDATANTGFISQSMKDVARETKVCSIMLLQTQKHSTGGDVSEPLMSMKQIKGSSIIEQSSSVLMTLWREGYNPKTQDEDRYISFAVVKNRFGGLWTDDFEWSGVRGHIGSALVEEQRELLDQLKKKKKALKADNDDKNGWD